LFVSELVSFPATLFAEPIYPARVHRLYG